VNRQKCRSDDLITIDANFACQLERELAAANSKIELLMSANADVARIAGERDAAEKRIRLLIAERDTAQTYADQKWKLRREFHDLFGTDDVEQGVAAVRKYQDRIKQLEGELMEVKNKHAVLVADVVLNEDRGERIKRLEEALEGTVKWIVDLADSGDAGFWNPDEQSVIIAARAALEAKEAKL
jgi:hypothetical protein